MLQHLNITATLPVGWSDKDADVNKSPQNKYDLLSNKQTAWFP